MSLCLQHTVTVGAYLYRKETRTTLIWLPSTVVDIYDMTIPGRLKDAPGEGLVKRNGISLGVIFYWLFDSFRIKQTEITVCLINIRTFIYLICIWVTALYLLTNKSQHWKQIYAPKYDRMKDFFFLTKITLKSHFNHTFEKSFFVFLLKSVIKNAWKYD